MKALLWRWEGAACAPRRRRAVIHVSISGRAVVLDPDTRTAVVVPVNPQSDVQPEVTAMLKALTAEGKVRPGQIVQIVVRHGNQVTQVISNAPVP
jgi:hypothetical protein